MSIEWPIVLTLAFMPILLLIWQRIKKPVRKPAFVSESARISSLPSFKKVVRKSKRLMIIERILLVITMAGLLILGARPVMPTVAYSEEKSRDIVLVLDVSGSVEEYIPMMLDAMEDVIKANPSERYAIITFAGRANTVLPLTRDPVAIQQKIEMLRQVYKHNNDPGYQFDTLNGGGTDIGEGILQAVNRFTNIETYKSRNIILLSDLMQTGGDFDKNSEFYLDKISLLPKYRIKFYIARTPDEYEYLRVGDDIAQAGGGTVYAIDKSKKDDSIREISNNIYNQILNTNITVGKNMADYPGPFIIATTVSAVLWLVVLMLRWGRL